MLLLSGDYSSASYLQDDIRFVMPSIRKGITFREDLYVGLPECWKGQMYRRRTLVYLRMFEGSNVSKLGVSKMLEGSNASKEDLVYLRMFEGSNVSKVGVSKDVGRRLPRG